MRGRKHELFGTAAYYGLSVGMWAPGDGLTRYRFFDRRTVQGGGLHANYFEGRELYTAEGIGEAEVYLRGVAAGWYLAGGKDV